MKKKMLGLLGVLLAGMVIVTGCVKTDKSEEDVEIIMEDIAEEENIEWKYDYLDHQEISIHGGRAAMEAIIDEVNAIVAGDEDGTEDDQQILNTVGAEYDLFVKRAVDSEKLVAIFQTFPGMHHTYITILTSCDNGNTWNISEDSELYGVGAGYDVLYFKNYIILSTYHSVCESGFLEISYDNGKKFTSYYYVDLYNQGLSEEQEGFGVRAELLEVDENENTIRIKWTEGREDSELFTADYDLIGNMKRIVNINNENMALRKTLEDLGNPEAYIFPESSERYLTESEIKELCNYAEQNYYDSEKLIRKSINEIYARLGYDFTGTDFYEHYLKQKTWYTPVEGKVVAEEELNQYEKANIDLLVSIEKQLLLEE